MLFNLIYIISFLFCSQIEPFEGLRDEKPRVWALVNSTIHTEPDKFLLDGTIIIRDGIIQDVGKDILVPDDAVVIDMTNKHIYSGFIESYFNPKIEYSYSHQDDHWNHKVNAHRSMSKIYEADEKKMEQLHSLGFTTACVVPDSGIFKGSSALIQLNRDGTVLNSNVSQNIGFEVDGWGSDQYPNSLLGVVALIRQTFIDANWYSKAKNKIKLYPEYNEPIKINQDLEVIGRHTTQQSPFLFETKDELSILRSLNIAEEFGLNIWLYGNGYEYRRISDFKELIKFIIIPLDFPSNPDISNVYQELQYTTSELKHWDMAPDNPSVLEKNNIAFSITSNGLSAKEFKENLNLSIKRGLSEAQALASLTTIPAKRMSNANKIGKVKPGYIANLTISEGNYFNPNSQVASVWIGGQEISVKPKYQVEVDGIWNMKIGQVKYDLKLENKTNKYSGKMIADTTEFKLSKLNIEGRFINWQVQLDTNLAPIRFNGHILGNRIEGFSQDLNQSWEAIKSGISNKKNTEINIRYASDLDVFYPEGAYGFKSPQLKSKDIIIKNTTLWTSSSEGVLKDIDILFADGKVKKIAENIKSSSNVIIIDGTNKHVTPGLIDCHSHSAVFAINEGTQSITSEVRIQDVLNSDDITIYRELAGGLTMANILHGSANTIGGQNAVIKLRWGSKPSDLLFKNAFPGIKFALGENVKQANWGDDYTTRYPQTRMGVEQVLRDAFLSAVEYHELWNDYKNNKKAWNKKIPPKIDLELEALVEIINGRRQIHCHSYRQDEILMLTRVAEDFGFKVGTFQHVLEGYKVADRIKEHGANASTFSDWWAYKYEVIDAIPYNGALMTEVGVNVSFNSDSRELARRMNTEATKGVKYGGLSEHEALKLVTINPAIQLGIDKWVGSLELGKDADFVIWSENPLSTKAICEQTWIDGIQYFSIERDKKLKERDRLIRKEIVSKILINSKAGSKTKWHHHEQQSAKHHHCLEQP